jgi:RNA polymerase sigma factor (sigma-70 family)
MATYQINISDKELWEQFLSGNDNALKEMYEKSINDLFYYGVRFSTDEELVKDCIQDLFINLHQSRSTLGKTDKIMPYLMVSLKRIIVKRLIVESTNKHLDIDRIQFDFELSEDKDNVNEDARNDVLQNALDNLTARQREAIYLRYVTGLSYEELSEVLKMSYQASRNLIYRGMQKLRSSLDVKLIIFYTIFCKCNPFPSRATFKKKP